MMRTILGWCFTFLMIAALYFVYMNLPIAWKGWLAKSFKGLWKAVKGAFGH